MLHYLWLAKKANPDPYYYAAAFALLMAIRAWDWLPAARCGRAPHPDPLPSGERGA